MPDTWQASSLRLPKGWPERVRSAVLNAISLAHFSSIYTRSWAGNNRNARIRLKQQNDRLRQEVALLTEEMRIKDARMLRTPAQRRPHYPPTERLAILELRAARGWNAAQTARRLLVTPTNCVPRAAIRTTTERFVRSQGGVLESRDSLRRRVASEGDSRVRCSLPQGEESPRDR